VYLKLNVYITFFNFIQNYFDKLTLSNELILIDIITPIFNKNNFDNNNKIKHAGTLRTNNSLFMFLSN